ncbi:MAG: peptidoglycan recognition protein, partial [Acidimicrobiia bacterium]|nr:peptidoglycan recognition protein [Acidimicrobiia bacterium]
MLAAVPLGSFLAVVLLAAPVTSPPTPPGVNVDEVGLTTGAETARAGWGRQIDVDANLVGVEWHGDAGARFTVEARHGERWERVGEIEAPDPSEGPDPGTRDARRESSATVSEPIWVGDTSAVRVRLADGEARGVTLHAVDAPPERPSGNVAGALAPRPGIITRGQWGADEGLRLRNCPEGPEYASDVRFAVVHHSAGGNSYSPSQSAQLVRGIYAYHTQANGWCDVGYNFLIDRYGQVFEGRYGGIERSVIGAHAQGFNTGSTGVAVLGNFVGASPPSAVTSSLVKLLAWKLVLHDVKPNGWVSYRTAGSNRYSPGSV